MNTLSYKTEFANKDTVEHKWHVIDAEGAVVGRLCSQIAHVLRGKHKPSYTQHADCADYVIVINAEKVRFTGKKLMQNEYITFSGYPGGQKVHTAKEVMDKKPTAIVETAVRGMLPKNKLGRQLIKKLYVYEGEEHPHQAQQPETLTF